MTTIEENVSKSVVKARVVGKRNYLIEGGSGTGKTSVAEALQQRGYHVIHGDRELKYRGDPNTGEPVAEPVHASAWDQAVWQHAHLLWDIDKVTSVIADHRHAITFFCGGSRNFSQFIDVFDGVFVLEVDNLDTLYQRLDARVARDPTDWGGKPAEKALVAQLHRTKEGIPSGGIVIDATQPLVRVVDEILRVVAQTRGMSPCPSTGSGAACEGSHTSGGQDPLLRSG